MYLFMHVWGVAAAQTNNGNQSWGQEILFARSWNVRQA